MIVKQVFESLSFLWTKQTLLGGLESRYCACYGLRTKVAGT